MCEVLSGAKKRDLYDKRREQAIKKGGAGDQSNSFMDIFNMLLRGGGRMKKEKRGASTLRTLKDLCNWCNKKASSTKECDL